MSDGRVGTAIIPWLLGEAVGVEKLVSMKEGSSEGELVSAGCWVSGIVGWKGPMLSGEETMDAGRVISRGRVVEPLVLVLVAVCMFLLFPAVGE